MKNFSFLFIGILFGIVMTKSEAVSWYRIQEMFRFDSIHMYGIIGVAVGLGLVMHVLLKKYKVKALDGSELYFQRKPPTYIASIAGGSIFGLGWAMTGACPGPLYVLLGHGYASIAVIIVSAILGAFVYGIVRSKLPH